jgi:hypothetical protein
VNAAINILNRLVRFLRGEDEPLSMKTRVNNESEHQKAMEPEQDQVEEVWEEMDLELVVDGSLTNKKSWH